MTRPAATLFWWQLCLRFDSESDCRWQCGQKHSQMEGEITRLGGTERPRVGGSDQRWRKSGRPGPRKCWPCAGRSKFGPCLRLGPPKSARASVSPSRVMVAGLRSGLKLVSARQRQRRQAWAWSRIALFRVSLGLVTGRPAQVSQAVTVSESRAFQVEVSPSFTSGHPNQSRPGPSVSRATVARRPQRRLKAVSARQSQRGP